MSSPHDELVISANGAEVRRASEWLASACQQHDVPQAQAERLELCLNEVLANIIDHGGTAAVSVPIRLLLAVGRDQDCSKASVTISDAGMPFNPVTAPNKSLPQKLADATVGGLGLVMIHRCADWLDYRHEDGCNHLTFGARWNLQ